MNLPQAFLERKDSVKLFKMFLNKNYNDNGKDMVEMLAVEYKKRYVLCTQLNEYIIILGYNSTESKEKYIKEMNWDETVYFIYDTKKDIYIFKG